MNSLCHVFIKYRAIKHSISEAIKFIDEKQMTIKGLFPSLPLSVIPFQIEKSPITLVRKEVLPLKGCLCLNVANKTFFRL